MNKNLRHLAKELYEFVNGLSPEIRSDFFSFRETPHNFRNFKWLQCDNMKTVKFLTKTITYRGSMIRSLIPENNEYV